MLRVRRLIALEETATISNPAENARNQLWFVIVAEAVVELILLRKVQIQANIKLLLILHEHG